MSTQQCSYQFRMYPNVQQERSLHRFAGARRWVWNWALARRKAYYTEYGRGITRSQLSAELTALKKRPETEWLKELNAQSLQQPLRDLDRAYNSFFKRSSRLPKFKSKKHSLRTFCIPQNARIVDSSIRIPKIGYVRIRNIRPIKGKSKSATFKQDSLGHWYVTLVVDFTISDTPLRFPNLKDVIGVDVGLKDFYVLSNGEYVEAPKFYKKAQKKLRQAQRRLSRRQLGSKRRAKAKRQVARIHNKVANQRKDFLHKQSIDLIRRFEGICIENLNISGLVRTKLAKSFLDASHGEFRRQLKYKAIWYRKHLVAVDRFFPSTKLCSVCGFINNNLTLADRIWTCLNCGTVHYRDLNAAYNLKVEGLRLLAVGYTDNLNAHGADVRPHVSEAIGAEVRIL